MSLDKTPTSGEDVLSMSDEDIMNMVGPPGTIQEEEDKDPADTENTSTDQEQGQATEPVEAEENTSEAETEAQTEVPEVEADAGKSDDGKVEAGTDKDTKDKTEAPAAEDKSATDKAPEGAKDEEKKETSSTGSEGGIANPTAEQALAFYKQIMAPFKANGKMIELKDPSEVISLMQMGANYTRKLQDIQPHRKMLMMLQNNDLLDEGKLSYLIDLDKKNPEAIKKLIKDSGLDPMDIDTSVEPAYFEGNHRVSDEEASFRQTLDELTSTQTGKETVQTINTDWDQASKEALWKSPQIMSIINEARENGVYDLITTEVNRLKVLGQIPPNVPFLQAYQEVGNQLAQAGKIGGPGQGQQQAPEVVATRVAAPKTPVANGDKASAASPTRTTPRKVEKLVNPLAMSDEEFLKLDQFNGRF